MAARATGEIAGKLASLVLFAALGRATGEGGLGVFVFAFALLQVAIVPVDLGYDRWAIRRLAVDRSDVRGLVADVFLMKLVLAGPVLALTFAGVAAAGYGSETRNAVYVAAVGVMIDSFARTAYSVFTAWERNERVAISLVAQRFSAAGLGLIALAAGGGVVSVAATYAVGAGLGLIVALALLRQTIGGLPSGFDRSRWRATTRASLPFAVQDVFTAVIFRVDAVILSLMTSQAAVGRYGAAYRLFEATFFLPVALSSAFAPMYTYLEHDSDPPVRPVFARSLKLALVLLLPVAVSFLTLAEPWMRIIFGRQFEDAAGPLRLLAPAVVLLALVTLASSLVVGRGEARSMVKATAAMAALNVALNVALIPGWEESGAALAMLVTEAFYAVVSIGLAVRMVGSPGWTRTLAAPLLAAAVMVAPALALADHFWLAMPLSLAVFAAAYAGFERLFSPTDLRFALDLVRGRMRAGEALR